jgi:hypothetical protein
MLVIEELQNDIEKASEEARKMDSLEESARVWAEYMSKAIDNYIRSGDVNTTGDANNQTGKMT